MIYLLIANEADLQQHKRDIAKRAKRFENVYKRFLTKVGLFEKKCKRSRGWGCTFLLTCMTPLVNSKIENQARPMEISGSFLHHPWKFHFFFSWPPGISICSFFNTPGNSVNSLLWHDPWKFLNFSALGTYELLCSEKSAKGT